MNPSDFEKYEDLAPITLRLYEQVNDLAWMILPVAFFLSILFCYTKDLGLTGATLVKLKKLIATALLLVAFPEVTKFLQIFGQEIALHLDDLNGIDFFLEKAATRAKEISFSAESILSFGGDFLVGALAYISYLVLLFARFIILAFYHFYWFLLVVLGPFLILTNLFFSTEGICRNLFKNIFFVSCWPIIWSILSIFLKAMPFAQSYATDGGYVTIIVLNFIVAVALACSPFIISGLCEGIVLSTGAGLGSRVKGIAMRGVSIVGNKIAPGAGTAASAGIGKISKP